MMIPDPDPNHVPDNALMQLLGELFPAGEKVESVTEEKEEEPKRLGGGVSADDMLEAALQGPSAMLALLVATSKDKSDTPLKVEDRPTGVKITYGDAVLDLSPTESVSLFLQMEKIIQRRASPYLLMLNKLLGLP